MGISTRHRQIIPHACRKCRASTCLCLYSRFESTHTRRYSHCDNRWNLRAVRLLESDSASLCLFKQTITEEVAAPNATLSLGRMLGHLSKPNRKDISERKNISPDT